ncbi:hydrogenase iron-sulfur subunit [Desulfallas sp. Bu1-1]|nr:hydrogenase iron-sulfur subunit [Desulfallas sp. Bu1-1]
MARRKFALLKNLLEYIGVDEGRVNFSWVSAAEGGRFAELVRGVTAKVKEIGPNKGLISSESGCCGCKN